MIYTNMNCKNCGARMTPNSSFCAHCGTPIGQGNKFCPDCAAPTVPGAKFCMNCGCDLNGQPVAQHTQQPRQAQVVQPAKQNYRNEKQNNEGFNTTSFIGSIKNGILNSVNFRGRTGRAEFGWWMLFYGIIFTITAIPYFGWFAVSPLLLAVSVPTCAVSARRVRDTGRKWAMVFMFLIPIAGTVFMILWGTEKSKQQY